MDKHDLPTQVKKSTGLRIFAGCAITLVAFIVGALLIYQLIFLGSLSGGGFIGDTSFFLVMIGAPVCGVAAAIVMAIITGVLFYRAKQPRSMAFGLLTAAGISLLFAVIALLFGYGMNWIVGNISTLTVPQMQTASSINLGIQLLVVLVGLTLGAIGGVLVQRRHSQKQG